jgi:SAM-dependent methyltransferase
MSKKTIATKPKAKVTKKPSVTPKRAKNPGLDTHLEIVNESIYDHPKYYDLVFGSDCAPESKFIVAASEAYGLGKPKRMFEPACGTGRLLDFLSRRGYEVGGLDLNPHAVEFCNARFRRRGMSDVAFVADMSDFKVRKKYDIAFNTINSFRHVSTEAAARNHLICMGQAVAKGGVYLLGVHLTPTQAEPSDGESWAARRGHLSINTHMWTNDRNTKSRVERFGIYFDVHRPQGSFRIVDELVLRSYTPTQMNRLIASAGCWQSVETFDFSYDIRSPIVVDKASEDVVYVLKRI